MQGPSTKAPVPIIALPNDYLILKLVYASDPSIVYATIYDVDPDQPEFYKRFRPRLFSLNNGYHVPVLIDFELLKTIKLPDGFDMSNYIINCSTLEDFSHYCANQLKQKQNKNDPVSMDQCLPIYIIDNPEHLDLYACNDDGLMPLIAWPEFHSRSGLDYNCDGVSVSRILNQTVSYKEYDIDSIRRNCWHYSYITTATTPGARPAPPARQRPAPPDNILDTPPLSLDSIYPRPPPPPPGLLLRDQLGFSDDEQAIIPSLPTHSTSLLYTDNDDDHYEPISYHQNRNRDTHPPLPLMYRLPRHLAPNSTGTPYLPYTPYNKNNIPLYNDHTLVPSRPLIQYTHTSSSDQFVAMTHTTCRILMTTPNIHVIHSHSMPNNLPYTSFKVNLPIHSDYLLKKIVFASAGADLHCLDQHGRTSMQTLQRAFPLFNDCIPDGVHSNYSSNHPTYRYARLAYYRCFMSLLPPLNYHTSDSDIPLYEMIYSLGVNDSTHSATCTDIRDPDVVYTFFEYGAYLPGGIKQIYDIGICVTDSQYSLFLDALPYDPDCMIKETYNFPEVFATGDRNATITPITLPALNNQPPATQPPPRPTRPANIPLVAAPAVIPAFIINTPIPRPPVPSLPPPPYLSCTFDPITDNDGNTFCDLSSPRHMYDPPEYSPYPYVEQDDYNYRCNYNYDDDDKYGYDDDDDDDKYGYDDDDDLY